MLLSRAMVLAGTAVGLAAAMAAAQPRIVLIGGGSIADMTSDASVLVGAGSDGAGGSAGIRWMLGGSVARSVLGARDATGVASDGLAASGNSLNTGGVAGQPTTATIGNRWTQAGGWQVVGTFDTAGNCSGTINTANDISGNGRYVVGGGWVGGCGSFRAFVYDGQTGVFTNLGGLNGANRATRANAVSADGSVIVGFDTASTGPRIPAVWRWDAGTMAYAETLLNPDVGEIYDINNAGTICVGTSNEFPGQLVRWTWDGSAWVGQGLGIPAGLPSWGLAGYAFESLAPGGMSEDGTVIVGIVTYNQFAQRFRGGFIWTPTTGVPVDLQDYMAGLPTPPPGMGAWPNGAFTSGIAVSADGTMIAGNPFAVAGAPGSWVIDLDGGPCVSPAVAAQPAPVTISACSSLVVLNAAFSGVAPFTYQWYKDGVPVADGDGDGNGSTVIGANAAQLRITSAVAADTGSYTCTFSSGCGDAATDPAVVSIGDALANDTCEAAAPIGLETVTWSPCGALVTDGIASCQTSTADVWYRFTPGFSGPIDVSTCGSTSTDTVLSVFADGCLGFELACSDNCTVGCATGSGSSRIERLEVSAGEAVLIRVATRFSPSSSAALSLTVSQSPAGPANDSCASAQEVGEGAFAFDTTLATTDGFASCGATSGRDVWFRYTPTFTGDARISTCGTSWNTVLSVHADGCGPELACNDQAGFGLSGCSNNASRLPRLAVTAGQAVLIRVAGVDPCTGGAGTLTVGEAPPLPANDACATATVVGAGEHAFDVTEATDELTEGCNGGSTSRDVWFLLAPQCAGTYTVHTCGSGLSNPMLHTYGVCGGPAIACSNDVGGGVPGCTSQQSRIEGVVASSSEPVLVRISVSGSNAPSNGTGTLTVVRTALACPADHDCNGSVNSSDISAFLATWLASVAAGDLAGDFNGDGATNSSDISAFLAVWLTGVQVGC